MATDHRGQPLHAGKRTHDELFELGRQGMGFDGRMASKGALLTPRTTDGFAQENEQGVVEDPYLEGRVYGGLEDFAKTSESVGLKHIGGLYK
jgi:hypothetical protein